MADNFKTISDLDISFKEFMPGQIIQSAQFNDDMRDIEEKVNEVIGEHNKVSTSVMEHICSENNPHRVTAHQVGTYTTTEIDEFIEDVKHGHLYDRSITNSVLADWSVDNRTIKDRTITASKVDDVFGSQIDISENIEITGRYTKNEVDELVRSKVGEGAYTKEEIDQKFEEVQSGQIIDKTISADKVTVDFGDKIDISNNPSIVSRYTKGEVDMLISMNGLPKDWGNITEQVDVDTGTGSLPVAGHMVAGQFVSPATSVLDIDVKENVEARGEYNSVGERLNGVDSQIKDIMNEIGTEILSTSAQDLKGAINELFQSVSNGKTLVASAITDKGVNTSSNDSFSTMATNISNISSSGGGSTIINMSDKTVHFSIDDFYRALSDITINADTYTSIFDNTTFSTLKSLHDTYGATIICNCYNYGYNGSNEYKIENVTTKYKQEFAQNDWLKFSYHQNYNETYDSSTQASTVLEYYRKCHNAVLTWANECNWSYTTRLASYTGNDSIISALSSEGVLVVLVADDDRVSYGLTTTENNYLLNHGYYYKNNCLYIKTNFRYENGTFNGEDFANISNAVVFTHEDYLQAQLTNIQNSFTWFTENGYNFSDMQSLGEFIATVNGNAPGTTEYSITNNLTNCATNNSDTSIMAKASYSAILTANDGYTLDTPVITMGGTDITSTCYNVETGAINIALVMGNIIITCTASETVNVNYVSDVILDGNCYFNTRIKPEATIQIETKFYSATGVQNCICGSATAIDTDSSTQIVMMRVNWSNYQFMRGYNKADVVSLSSKATDDGYYLGSGSSDGSYGMPSELDLYIGALNVAGTSQSYVCKSGTKICYVKITINNVVVGDFHAALDDSGNPCLYDKVSKQFIYNVGNGILTYTS